MKVGIFSDLHAEFDENCCNFKDLNCDLIVLAGDIHRWNKSVEWIKKNFPEDKKIIYVAGNHEFYGTTIDKGIEFLKKEASKTNNIIFLEREEFVENDIVFLGTTLWSDFNLFGDFHKIKGIIKAKLNDFSMIKTENGERLNPENLRDRFFQSLNFLEEKLKQNKDKKIVIITHNAPSIKAIDPSVLSLQNSYEYRKLAAAFASTLDYLMKENSNIKLWIYGHTHYSTQFTIGKTITVSNQKGYPFEENKNFRKDLVFQV